MPHVVSQWQGGDWPPSPKSSVITPTKKYHHGHLSEPVFKKHIQQRSECTGHNLAVLTPDSFQWRDASPRSVYHESSGFPTPALTSDSIPELPSSVDLDRISVNPPFIELEAPFYTEPKQRSPPRTDPSITFKTCKPLVSTFELAQSYLNHYQTITPKS